MIQSCLLELVQRMWVILKARSYFEWPGTECTIPKNWDNTFHLGKGFRLPIWWPQLPKHGRSSGTFQIWRPSCITLLLHGSGNESDIQGVLNLKSIHQLLASYLQSQHIVNQTIFLHLRGDLRNPNFSGIIDSPYDPDCWTLAS